MSKITDGLLRRMCKCRVSSLAQRYREEIMVSKDVACRRCYRQIASATAALSRARSWSLAWSIL